MRNYQNYNQYTSSKAYYSDLKNQSKNLNSSKIKLDKPEKGLQKLLQFSYNVFNPLFKGEDTEEYKPIKLKEELDNDFDQKITSHTPLWIVKLVSLLILIYNKYFGKKITTVVQFTVKQVKLISNNFNASNKKKFIEILTLSFFIKTKPT